MTDAQRRALMADLTSCLWCDAPERELARVHGVGAGEVRELRDMLDRTVWTAEALHYARRIAAETGSSAPVWRIVLDAMRARLRAAQARPRRVA